MAERGATRDAICLVHVVQRLSGHLSPLLALSVLILLDFESLANRLPKLLLVTRFFEKRNGAFLHGPHGHRHIGIARNHDDGQAALLSLQLLEQIQAGHPRHANIDDDAPFVARIVLGQELLSRREPLHSQALQANQGHDRLACSCIVIDDKHRAVVFHLAHFDVHSGMQPCTIMIHLAELISHRHPL